MTEEDHHLVAIHLEKTNSLKLQQVLTKYPCTIKTRLGLSEVSTELCGTKGIVILELIGEKRDTLFKEITEMDEVEVKRIVFNH
ncbi:hypothetical protein M0813_21230 [Anaeramoeba flamelloides]|uniref:CopG family transcriptional regulator n=1 Tax=Anaeramoeba flamelloides TaxID=1746091 RepID=A0ABQ8YJ62_9EUKA|nr:hypothetical protein M0813_21230 [Anaeramoeba flamelloides]